MASTIARSILTVRSTASAALLPKRVLFSTVSGPPPLPGFGRLRTSTVRSAVPALTHSIRVISPVRVNPVRCRVNRSGSSYSPLNSGSNFNDRPPTEMAPLFPGCDYEHWLIVMDKPGGEGATKQQMIDCYIQTLAKVLGRLILLYSISISNLIYLFMFTYSVLCLSTWLQIFLDYHLIKT